MLLWDHFPPGLCTGTCTAAWQGGRCAKRVSYGIWGGRIMTPHVEGMSAVYAVSLEMLGEMQRGKIN